MLNLPDTVDFDNKEALVAMAFRLYEKGNLSLGQAVEQVGISKRKLIIILRTYRSVTLLQTLTETLKMQKVITADISGLSFSTRFLHRT